ncbi:MAG: MFS transporter [Gammaproteobacteria bacterium]|nr:MFS transporter [Gammaproteobacteria bacterium]MCH9744172.1 MFS transporter [Gammaproteobacteria bacterium]
MAEVARNSQSKSWMFLAWLMCGVAILFYFYEYMLRITPSIITPQLMHTYRLNARSFGNLSASFYYIYAPMQIFVGLLIDRYGPRRLLTMAALISSLGVYFFASMQSLMVARLGRLLIGFGCAFAFVGVLKLATIWLSHKRLALISGTTMAVGMMGGVIGDLVMMDLVNHQGWRLACYIIACVGLVLSVFIFILVRDNRMELKNPDYIDNTVSFEQMWQGIQKLIKNPQIWLNGIIGCLLFMPLTGFAESWQVPYLSYVVNFSHRDAVLAASMVFLGWAIGAPVVGWISDEFKQRRLPITIGTAMATVLIAYILYVPPSSKNALYVLLLLYGICSSVQSINYAICCENTPPQLTGTAISLTSMIVMLSGFSVYIVGAILEGLWKGVMMNGLHVYDIQSYQWAFLIFPAGLLLAVILTFYLKPEISANNK